jgi:hypothetical protein
MPKKSSLVRKFMAMAMVYDFPSSLPVYAGRKHNSYVIKDPT